VIALSEAAMDRDQERAAKAGFYHYLTKPVHVDELLGGVMPHASAARRDQ